MSWAKWSPPCEKSASMLSTTLLSAPKSPPSKKPPKSSAASKTEENSPSLLLAVLPGSNTPSNTSTTCSTISPRANPPKKWALPSFGKSYRRHLFQTSNRKTSSSFRSCHALLKNSKSNVKNSHTTASRTSTSA